MKRLFYGLITIVLVSLVNVGYAHASSTNDFTVNNFQADYYLDIDNNGQSTLKTVESITAEFPNFDQNHGIERALVSIYDGHSTNLMIQSVTNQYGDNLSYTTSRQRDNLVLRIGDANLYVHGFNTYEITYTQRSVTRFFSNTNDDEFYWDVNGIDWLQSFGSVTAKLHIGKNILNSLNGNEACYYGKNNSTNKCIITRSNDVFTANVTNLSANENLTIAIGFQAHTFNEYHMTFIDFVNKYVDAISVMLSLLVVITLIILRLTKGRNAPGRGTIIAEYLPPKDADIVLSSVIKNKATKWLAAMYVDLAVRRNIKIIERGVGSYALEFITIDGLTATEVETIKAIFGDTYQSGSRYNIEIDNADLAFISKLSAIYKRVKRWSKSNGYYTSCNKLKFVMLILSVFAILQSAAVFFISTNEVTLAIGLMCAITGIVIVSTTNPLSQKGRELADYLDGLSLYIKIAEEDRIKVLQSPQGADKTPVDISSKDAVVHLYERVLSYAVLFDIEKDWANVLGKYYEQQGVEPAWYVGRDTFNALLFSSSLSNFSQNVTSAANFNNYGSSISSSGGGSLGGGFSGGGGGGGGGGGW